MDFTLIEINKHKNNISNLSTRLLNTFDINEEISINNEIKKETEILDSLLNIKMNSIMAQNQQMMQFQIQQQMQAQQNMFNQMQNMQNNPLNNNFPNQIEQSKKSITVIFWTGKHDKDGNPISQRIQCILDEKVSKVIERYRMQANDVETNKNFIFNAHLLNPTLTVAEAGLSDNSNIFAISTESVRGG